ncbi:hypothetical protein D9M71_785370 [compost metagenome]
MGLFGLLKVTGNIVRQAIIMQMIEVARLRKEIIQTETNKSMLMLSVSILLSNANIKATDAAQ